MNNETISSNGISPASLVNYVNRVLNLGLDVHYRQVTVAMQEDGGRIKAAGKMGHMDFLNWVQKKLQEGWQIYSCYEAGASGYWLHRELVKLGVKNLVVVPKAMGQGGKKQKTDKRDAGELCDCLDRYLRGQDKALSVVGVPTEEQEEKRALIRYHRQIIVPSHAIRGTFLEVIATEVLGRIGVLTGFKCLLIKCWEFFRVAGEGGQRPPWPAGAGLGVERA